MDKVKFQFEMPVANAERLESLAREAGVTKKDIVNNALTVLEWAVEETKQGNKICSVSKAGETRQLVLPILTSVKDKSAYDLGPIGAEQDSIAELMRELNP